MINSKGIIEARFVENKTEEQLVLDGKILNICKMCDLQEGYDNSCDGCEIIDICKKYNYRPSCVRCEEWSEEDINKSYKKIEVNDSNKDELFRGKGIVIYKRDLCVSEKIRNLPGEIIERIGNVLLREKNKEQLKTDGKVLNICKMCHLQAEYYNCQECEIKKICHDNGPNPEFTRCEDWSDEDIERAYNILEVK